MKELKALGPAEMSHIYWIFAKVREVAIQRWDERDGIVYYEVIVNASGGRRWTVPRRYQDFVDLESITWQKRGPMPTFPMPWTAGQLSRKLISPFGKVGRLEAKRIMLEAWLHRLVLKARNKSMKFLRQPLCEFLDAETQCNETTPLEHANNDVTALINANTCVSVQTILLSLASEVELMKGRRGKNSMSKAKAGPLPVPMMNVDIHAPPKWLVFDLNQTRPSVRLALLNSSDQAFAFKVMATRVTRYFVQPSQTVIGPNMRKEVAIFIPDPDMNDVFEDGKDKFMFLTVGVGVDQKLDRSQLGEVWKAASAQYTIRHKLAAKFERKVEAEHEEVCSKRNQSSINLSNKNVEEKMINEMENKNIEEKMMNEMEALSSAGPVIRKRPHNLKSPRISRPLARPPSRKHKTLSPH